MQKMAGRMAERLVVVKAAPLGTEWAPNWAAMKAVMLVDPLGVQMADWMVDWLAARSAVHSATMLVDQMAPVMVVPTVCLKEPQ